MSIGLAFASIGGRASAQTPAEAFPAFPDGALVPARYVGPGNTGLVHVAENTVDSYARLAATDYCQSWSAPDSCVLSGIARREVRGKRPQSAYSVLDITLAITTAQGTSQDIIDGDILLVRSCPTDAVLVTDNDAFLDNRDRATGRSAVACVSPDALPKSASLGEPKESGANQCPIGNSPTVGNPLNPLTMSKIETVVDYAGTAASGLAFARTYHSGAFSLDRRFGKVAARYPAGARIGARWRHSWDRAFVRRPHYDGNGHSYGTALYLIREDGNETRFVKQGDTFIPAEGERGSVREHPEGGWAYPWPDLTVEHYDDAGRLRSRTDPNGNAVSLHYDEINVGIGFKATVLARIRDRQGRELRLSYDRLGRLETVDQPDGGRIGYSYSGDLLEGLDADLIKVTYPDGRVAGYLYDEPAMGGTPNHKLTGIVGGDGKRFATFRYDTDNRAIGSAHGDNLETTELAVSLDGSQVTVHKSEQPFAETWSPSYVNGQIRLGRRNEQFQHTDITRPFEYLGGGLVTRQTDYLGVPTTYRYDPARQLEVERTEADGTPVARTVKTTWHATFDKPVRIDNGAQWTTFAYDARGNLLEQREGGLADAANVSAGPWPEERVTRYTYDDTGRVLTIDGPFAGSDDITRYVYHRDDAPGCASGPATCPWREGDLHTVKDGLNHGITVLTRDGAGRVLASTAANGIRTDRHYDAAGRLTESAVRARDDGNPSAQDSVTRITYNANGDIDTVTDPDGATLTHRYNAAHRLVEQTDALGNRRLLERNGKGLVVKETYVRADGSEDLARTFAYDEHDMPEWVDSPALGTRLYSYDANGRFTGLNEGGSYKEAYARDERGRVSRIEHGYNDVGGKIHLTYDGTDRVKTVVDPKGLSTAYLRNGLGDLLWRRSPDTGDTTLENDANGQPVKETRADNRTVDRFYDRIGRLNLVNYRNAEQHIVNQVLISHDSSAFCTVENFPIGHMSTVGEVDDNTTFCYDFAGHVVQKIQIIRGVRLDLRYAYTPAGRLAAITYPDGRRVSYTRDVAGHVTGIDAQPPGGTTQPLISAIGYDAPGHVIGWTAGARIVQRLHDASGNPADMRDGRSDGFQAKVKHYNHSFLSEITTASASVMTTSDSAARVDTAGSIESTPENPYGSVQQYGYDKTGNRLSWMTLPFTNRRFEYSTDSHHLMVANKVAREYDATGNTTRIGEREFVYDETGRMTQAKVNGVVEMNYTYNPFGQQIARYIAGQTTVSLHDQAGHWLGDYDSAGRPIRQMVWLDDLPIAALDGDSIRDIQPDHLGTPRVVIDRATDKAIWTWSISGDAFGNDAPNEDPDGDGTKYVFDMRFPGQRYDAVTKLFQNGWRDYDPSSGRYIQSDPIGLAGGISTYAYVGSNPYVRVDPKGMDIVVVNDPNTVPIFDGFAGHAALLIGGDQKGWTYYSKDGVETGVQLDERKDYSSLDAFFADTGTRYKRATRVRTNGVQDFDARRWADTHINDTYSGYGNNCADLVYGALDAAGVPVSEPTFKPYVPNGIIPRIENSGGKVQSNSVSTPNWYPGVYAHKYYQGW